jgi:hypothetical protein
MKDPILLSNLQNPDTVRKMAENHRVLIEASDTICNALRSVKTTVAEQLANAIPSRQNFDDLSDSSSSSSGSEANSPQASTSAGRRITNDFLRRSLAAVAQQNQNSLASISQRNLSQEASNTISPSSSSSSVPGRRPPITSSMFMNAMNEVMRARRSESNVFGREGDGDVPMHSSSSSSLVDAQEVEPQPQPHQQSEERQSAEPEQMEEEDESARDARDIEMITSFQIQLKQMEDMGLSNKAANIQALMVCNGNLEAAVNLVLAEMNMS